MLTEAEREQWAVEFERKRERLFNPWAHGSKWSIHRPIFTFEWYDNDHFGIGLAWGERHGDPVWSVGVEINVGRLRRLGRERLTSE